MSLLRKTILPDSVFGWCPNGAKSGETVGVGPYNAPAGHVIAAEDIPKGEFISLDKEGKARVARGPRVVWKWQR